MSKYKYTIEFETYGKNIHKTLRDITDTLKEKLVYYINGNPLITVMRYENVECLNCGKEFHLDTFCKGDECKECGGILTVKEEIL